VVQVVALQRALSASQWPALVHCCTKLKPSCVALHTWSSPVVEQRCSFGWQAGGTQLPRVASHSGELAQTALGSQLFPSGAHCSSAASTHR
jgi:hypothetical protein